MKLLSSRGWEQLDWQFERQLEIQGLSYYQFDLVYKTDFWDRAQLAEEKVNAHAEDLNFRFHQVLILSTQFLQMIDFFQNLVNAKLSDLKIGEEKQFNLINEEGEKFNLVFSDDADASKYKLHFNFTRGKTAINCEMLTDITCLENFLNGFKEVQQTKLINRK